MEKFNYCSRNAAPYQGCQVKFVDVLGIQSRITIITTIDADGIIDDTGGMSKTMTTSRWYHAIHIGL